MSISLKMKNKVSTIYKYLLVFLVLIFAISVKYYFFTRVEIACENKVYGIYNSRYEAASVLNKMKERLEEKYNKKIRIAGDVVIKDASKSSDKKYDFKAEDLYDINTYGIVKNNDNIMAFSSYKEAKTLYQGVLDFYYKKAGSENTTVRLVSYIDDVKIKKDYYRLRDLTNFKEAFSEVLRENFKYLAHTVEKNDRSDLMRLMYKDYDSTYPIKRPGEVMEIKNPRLSLNVMSKVEVNEEQEVYYQTINRDDDTMAKGERVVERKGENGEKEVHSINSYINYMEAKREIISEKIIKEPVNERVIRGKSDDSFASLNLKRPTRGGISSGFGRRWGSFHSGVDINADFGDDVFAADSGVVTMSKYLGNYGNIIEIDHKNGYKTRYAHLSAMYKKIGDKVSKGELIAKVGTSGRVTGPHLHFEILVNNTPVDPMIYLRR